MERLSDIKKDCSGLVEPYARISDVKLLARELLAILADKRCLTPDVEDVIEDVFELDKNNHK